MTTRTLPARCLLAVCLFLTTAAFTNDHQLEAFSELPELPETIAPLITENAFRVLEGGAAMAEFWLRPELPTSDSAGEYGVDFGHLPLGTLIGVVRFQTEWSDYRKQTIAPGLYTMRYGVQPADGDHTGQSYFRDFLMLVPVEGDSFAADGGNADQEPIVEASNEVSGSEHPAVLALYQIYDDVSEISIVANDYGEPCLAIPMGDVTMGLVLEGHGSGLTL